MGTFAEYAKVILVAGLSGLSISFVGQGIQAIFRGSLNSWTVGCVFVGLALGVLTYVLFSRFRHQ